MRLLESIRTAPKRATALIAVAAAVVTVPAALLAWGPSRDTFTIQKPASYVTFNSITNNPEIGDERNFVGIKDASDTTASAWKDEVKVQPGKEYYVRMYVHNNAAANLNKVANDVTAKFNVPTQTANRIQIDGYLSASNASPKQVWDQAVFSSDSRFKLDYVEGSASYTNNVFPKGTKLSDSVVSSGAKLGYNKLDGKIPGCFKYDGIVIFKVKPVVDNFEIKKTVRLTEGSDRTFKENVTAKPGDKVDYQIEFKNTGSSQLKDVILKDTLPTGVSHVAGTTYLHNTSGTRKVSDAITSNGSNIGGYLPNGNAFMKFTAQIKNKTSDKECGHKTYRNVVKATTSAGSKEDTADVSVDYGACKPEDKYKKVCDIKSGKVITINEKDYDASKHAPENSDKCKEQPKMVKVCNPVTGETIFVDEKDADKYAPVNSDKCKDLEVCVIETKETKTIKKSEYDESIHTTDFSKCEATPTTPEEPETPETPEAPSTPETPKEMPKTGPADIAMQIAGLMALSASSAYYAISRRQA